MEPLWERAPARDKDNLMLRCLALIALFLAGCTPVAPRPSAELPDARAELQAFRGHYAAVRSALAGDDASALLAASEAALALMPDLPNLHYARAVALAKLGRSDEALTELDDMAATGLAFRIAQEPGLVALRSQPRFAALVEQFEANRQPRGPIELAFNASGLAADFIPESILRDEANGRWWLGSVRHARIDAVDQGGAAYDFVAAGDGGLLGVLGMRALGDTLWVASAGLAETAGIAKADIGRSGLFEIDARSGRVRRSWWLPVDGQMHALGDVLVLASDVFASDSLGGGIYRLDAARASLQALVAPGLLLSPQGMVELDRRQIVIADYPTGLWLLDRETGALRRLPTDTGALTGIDGLYAHQGDLIAIQNGTAPKRILRIRLDAAGERVAAVEVLAQNLLGWGEPSLATIHHGALYYIANSQWDRFDANAQLPPLDQLEPPRVMRLPLD